MAARSFEASLDEVEEVLLVEVDEPLPSSADASSDCDTLPSPSLSSAAKSFADGS
jgi:hypothetical protein